MKSDRRADISTEVKRTKKPHDKFSMQVKFDSLPVELSVKADKTNVEAKNLSPNPKKCSFGKIEFKAGMLEACSYPLKHLSSVLWFLKIESIRSSALVTDLRRIRELLALTMKIRYFLRLSRERKLQYLRRKGFFANINTIRDKLSVPKKHVLDIYMEALGLGE